MKKILVVMVMLSLVISAGCSNGNKKENQTSIDISEEIQSSAVEDSVVSKDVSEKSTAESSTEESSEISQVKEKSLESEESSEIKAESEEESEVESIAESSVEGKAEGSSDEAEPEISEESSEDETLIPVTNKEIAGFYNLTEWKENGETVMDLKSHNDRGLFATMTINENGTGEFSDFGTVVGLKWNDKYIILDDEKAKYRLEKDSMILFNENVEMVFERADKETLIPSQDKEKVELSGSADKSHAGKYVISALLIDGEEDITDVVDEEDWYIILNEDGTGKWASGEEILEIKWAKGQILNENEIFNYILKDDVLSLEAYGITMEYKKA